MLDKFAGALAARGVSDQIESPLEAAEADLTSILAENGEAVTRAVELLGESPSVTDWRLSALLAAVGALVEIPERVQISRAWSKVVNREVG